MSDGEGLLVIPSSVFDSRVCDGKSTGLGVSMLSLRSGAVIFEHFKNFSDLYTLLCMAVMNIQWSTDMQ